MEFIAFAPDALPSLMLHVMDGLKGRKKVAVIGDMGAGKTTLIKAFCQHLGVHGNISSPTYSLVNDYDYKDENGQPSVIHHLDLYRLNKMEEALDIGIEELLDDPYYTFIEWPQLVESILPPDTAQIIIEITGETTRKIRIL
ncbi:MAG: tRNA (adenosine(37)-N6)-threonylcarbamoyltransferase complex ATPase subunit type 1 TsaE [Saprospiraceae bacterium]